MCIHWKYSRHIEIKPSSTPLRVKRRKPQVDRRKNRSFRFVAIVDRYITHESKRTHTDYTAFVSTCVLLNGCKVKPGMKFKITLIED